MSRRESRDQVFKLIFEYIFTHEIDEDLLNDYLSEVSVADEQNYIKDVYYGVAGKFDYLLSKIEKYSIGFKAKRIYKIDLAIMMLSVFEMEFLNSIPLKVSINEACELAKVYSTQKSVGFINGILAKVGEEIGLKA